MRYMIVLLVLLVGGCEVSNPDQFRTQSQQHTYSLIVPGTAENVHRAIVNGTFAWGWADSGVVQQEFYSDSQRGSVWVFGGDWETGINGWVLDVEGRGDQTQLTVHCKNAFYEDATRRMIAKIFGVIAATDQ